MLVPGRIRGGASESEYRSSPWWNFRNIFRVAGCAELKVAGVASKEFFSFLLKGWKNKGNIFCLLGERARAPVEIGRRHRLSLFWHNGTYKGNGEIYALFCILSLVLPAPTQRTKNEKCRKGAAAVPPPLECRKRPERLREQKELNETS